MRVAIVQVCSDDDLSGNLARAEAGVAEAAARHAESASTSSRKAIATASTANATTVPAAERSHTEPVIAAPSRKLHAKAGAGVADQPCGGNSRPLLNIDLSGA